MIHSSHGTVATVMVFYSWCPFHIHPNGVSAMITGSQVSPCVYWCSVLRGTSLVHPLPAVPGSCLFRHRNKKKNAADTALIADPTEAGRMS